MSAGTKQRPADGPEAAKPPPIDFSKIGVQVSAESSQEVIDYLAARDWGPPDFINANLRLLDGPMVEKLWPSTRQGTFDQDGKAFTDGKGSVYRPLYGVALPDTEDPTYATTRVFFDEVRIAEGDERPKKFRNVFRRSPKPYRPKACKLRDLRNPRKPLVLVEGPFKAYIAAKHGVSCLGVNGHFGAFTSEVHLPSNPTREEARAKILEELHEYLVPGREVVLQVDGDVNTNLLVRKSLLDFMTAVSVGFDCKPVFIDLVKGGLDDYFAAGNTLEDYLNLPRHTIGSLAVKALRCAFYDLTEIGGAQRLAALKGDDLKYDPRTGEWIEFIDRGYSIRSPRAAMIEVVETLKLETAAAKSKGERYARSEFHRVMSRSSAINAAIAIAAEDSRLHIDSSLFDADQNLLGMGNGIFNLEDGKLYPPSREFLVTKAVPFDYDPKARSELWQSVVDRAVANNKEHHDYLQEIAGSAVIGSLGRSEAIFVIGPAYSVKTVFIETIHDLLGPDYAAASKSALLMKARRQGDAESASPFLMSLRGKRLATCNELEEGDTLHDSTLKDLTGGDTIAGRKLHHDVVTFRNTARLMIRGQHFPNIVGTDDSVWGRIKLVPLDVVIPEKDRDLLLRQTLKAEHLPGIFNWAYEGLKRLRKNNYKFGVPQWVEARLADHREKADTLNAWFEDCIEGDPKKAGDSCKEMQTEVTQSYLAWAKRNGIEKHLTSKGLWKRIRLRLGFDPVYMGDKEKWARGFKLRRGSDNLLVHQQTEIEAKDALIAELMERNRKLEAAKRRPGRTNSTNQTNSFGKVRRTH